MTDQIAALFSGAGGLSLGFSRAGLKPTVAVDIDRKACETYTNNLEIDARPMDLGNLQQAELKELFPLHKNCFAVIGGPPCQGFSTAGSRKANDPRNQLVFRYLEIVDFLNPRWFLFENVEGILTSNHGESVRDLLFALIQRGYTLRLEKINFAMYGLPQSRKRVVIVGNRIGSRFSLPAAINSYTSGKHKRVSFLPDSPTLMDAIGDLPTSSEKDELVNYSADTNNQYARDMRSANNRGGVRHHFASPSALEIERLRLLNPGQTMHDLPEEFWHPSFRKRAYRRVKDGTPTERRGGPPAGLKRLRGNECAPTITSATRREFIHPVFDRPLTLREAARLQSFPDWFEFQGSPDSIALQIGNAVPPIAAELIASHIASIDSKFGTGVECIVKPGLLGFKLTDSFGMSPALERTAFLLKQLPSCQSKSVQLTMEDVYGT